MKTTYLPVSGKEESKGYDVDASAFGTNHLDHRGKYWDPYNTIATFSYRSSFIFISPISNLTIINTLIIGGNQPLYYYHYLFSNYFICPTSLKAMLLSPTPVQPRYYPYSAYCQPREQKFE